jgi:hypothetical protein
MIVRRSFASFLLLLAVLFLHHSPAFSQELEIRDPFYSTRSILARDGHSHHTSHTQPLVELNETEILMYHAPTPPSYYTIDWEENTDKRHPGLMISHAIFMSLAFFVALPMGELLKFCRYQSPDLLA